MTSRTLWWALPIALLVPATASAHFKLEQPVDALQTDSTGDPLDGTQKLSPCGDGTASGMVTRVRAGSTLHIKLEETVPHGGHYRIALAANPATISDPDAAVVDGNCVSAEIQSSPQLPILADGLFEHDDGVVSSGKLWETDITLPETPCASCTLQVIEFMTPHSPGCFYYHCAKLEIVEKTADVPDGGVVVGPDSGVVAPNNPAPGASDGGGTSQGSAPKDDSGCNVGSSSSPASVIAVAAGFAFVMSIVRRRRSRR